MSQIKGNKWYNLPNEVLELIIQDVKTQGKQVQWAMVNRKWYEWYQSIKYKDITIRLHLSYSFPGGKVQPDTLFENTIYSKFSPGKWVRSLKIESLASRSPFYYLPQQWRIVFLIDGSLL